MKYFYKWCGLCSYLCRKAKQLQSIKQKTNAIIKQIRICQARLVTHDLSSALGHVQRQFTIRVPQLPSATYLIQQLSSFHTGLQY